MNRLNAYKDLFIKCSFFQITELSSKKICHKLQDGEKLRKVYFIVFYDF